MACEEETGNPILVINVTEIAAAREAIEAVQIVCELSSLIVSRPLEPPTRAPNKMKPADISVATLNLTIPLLTVVPKTFEASLAPRDQPKNKAGNNAI
jgi:hypothetical protein